MPGHDIGSDAGRPRTIRDVTLGTHCALQSPITSFRRGFVTILRGLHRGRDQYPFASYTRRRGVLCPGTQHRHHDYRVAWEE